jgi:hypothetical protein
MPTGIYPRKASQGELKHREGKIVFKLSAIDKDLVRQWADYEQLTISSFCRYHIIKYMNDLMKEPTAPPRLKKEKPEEVIQQGEALHVNIEDAWEPESDELNNEEDNRY